MNSPPGTAIWEWIDLISSTLIPVELDSTNLLSNHVPIFSVKSTPPWSDEDFTSAKSQIPPTPELWLISSP
ncbi:hypothetical protein [Coleofasciculus sp. E1-EBD-02]|uniref:hypothetical protein n=1 Tax=Coleofasciculus sp. E1-EBD-02 TaxID=3068481 RepID=UPI0032FB9B6D